MTLPYTKRTTPKHYVKGLFLSVYPSMVLIKKAQYPAQRHYASPIRMKKKRQAKQ